MTHKFPEARLESLCEEVVDCPHSTPKWTDSGEVVIRNQNIRRGRLDLSTTSYTDEENYQKRSKRIELRPNDLIITREAPMGEVCIVPEGLRCCLGQRMVALRTDSKKIIPRYLLFALQGRDVQHQIGFNEGTGSTVSNMRIPVLKGLDIPVPDLSNQKAIAHILGTLDDKIELNQKMNQTLEEIAKAIFKSWFVDFDPVRAKAEGRPTGLPPEISDLFPEELVDSEIGEIPKGWEVSPLSEFIVEVGKKTKPSPETEVRPYVPIDCISSKSLTLWDFKNGEEAKSSLVSFKKGDILFGAMRPYFHKVCITPFDGTTRTTCLVLGSKERDYFSFSLLTLFLDSTIDFATQNSTGSTIPYIKWKNELESLTVPLPPVESAGQFNTFLEPILAKFLMSIKEQQVLSELRDTLLPKLISGELRIPDAEKFLEEAGI